MKKELLILTLLMVNAFCLGVSPSSKTIGPMMKGETHTLKILISTSKTTPMDVIPVTAENQKIEWMNFENDRITISKGNAKAFYLVISPPRDQETGTYIMETLYQQIATQEAEGATIVGGVMGHVKVIVSDEIAPLEAVIAKIIIFAVLLGIVGGLYFFRNVFGKKREDRLREERPRTERKRETREKKMVQDLLKKTVDENAIKEPVVEEKPKKKKESVQEKIKKTLGMEKPKTGIEEIAEEVEDEKEVLLEKMEEELSGTEAPKTIEEIVKKEKKVKKVIKKKDDLDDLEKQLEDQLKLIEKTKKEIEGKLKKK